MPLFALIENKQNFKNYMGTIAIHTAQHFLLAFKRASLSKCFYSAQANTAHRVELFELKIQISLQKQIFHKNILACLPGAQVG